jgi:GrpB-like predicted nucleotidyltransferase (UPF0157 family)
VVDHDPTWATDAAAEIDRLRVALGPVAVRVEHIGSTAVPGLAAKPIIDLQVSVAALEPRERYVRPLERAGYLFAPSPDTPDRRFFARPPERPRSHHVHVCAAGSQAEHRHLAVRDFLRAHPDEAERYGALKRSVAARHAGDRLAYIGGKEAAMVALEARALQWAGEASPTRARPSPAAGPPAE